MSSNQDTDTVAVPMTEKMDEISHPLVPADKTPVEVITTKPKVKVRTRRGLRRALLTAEKAFRSDYHSGLDRFEFLGDHVQQLSVQHSQLQVPGISRHVPSLFRGKQ
jgi:hypothetical protein